MKDELGGQVINEFIGLREKTYSYLKSSNDEDKKAKFRKCVIKAKPKFKDFENCLKVAQTKKKIKHLEKNKTDADRCPKEFIKIINYNKDLNLKSIMFLLKKLTRLV